MTATTRLTFALALAIGATAAGCGSDPSQMGGGDDDGGGGGGGSNMPKQLDPTGTYTMHSTFDLATNMPGTAGTVVNTIIAATDVLRTRSSQRDRAPRPRHQLEAQPLLQILHRPAQGGLGNVQFARRFGETEFLGHSLKIAQMTQIHGRGV